MSLEMSLWQVSAAELERVSPSQLEHEDRPEDCQCGHYPMQEPPPLLVTHVERFVLAWREHSAGP